MNRICLRYCLSLSARVGGVHGRISPANFVYLSSCVSASRNTRYGTNALPTLSTRRNVFSSPPLCDGVRAVEDDVPVEVEKPGMMKKFLKRMLTKTVYSQSGINLYRSCVEAVDYEFFFRTLNMPDTFHSWFLILQLHVWMLLVRLKQEGGEGKVVYNVLVTTMWKDVQERAKLIGNSDITTRNRSIRELHDQFNGLVIAYDIGLLSDDHVLAAALWRNLVRSTDDVNIVAVAIMVQYVRKQIYLLEQIDSQKLLLSGVLEWGSQETKEPVQS